MIQERYSCLLHKKEWKEKREEVLVRDEHKCTCCGKTYKKLYVHHKYYLAYPNGIKFMPWEYPNDALTTLCYCCHRQVHRTGYIVIKYRRY